MKPTERKVFRCAIYTRKSTEHNLDLEFNSLDAQREACEAYIKSQAHEGWRLIPDHYDDGAFSGASLDRPALQKLLADVRADKITIVVVYKVDRLTRSLADFAKLVELFDQHRVSFVSVTQSFNTTSSMGRLTLNVLLSFAQFEREVIGSGCATRSPPPSAGASGSGVQSRSAIPASARSSSWRQRRRGPSAPSSPAISSAAPWGLWWRSSTGAASGPRRGTDGRVIGGIRFARLSAQEPVLHRRGGLSWRGPSRGA
jgi:Resolvase, N terminal domain